MDELGQLDSVLGIILAVVSLIFISDCWAMYWHGRLAHVLFGYPLKPQGYGDIAWMRFMLSLGCHTAALFAISACLLVAWGTERYWATIEGEPVLLVMGILLGIGFAFSISLLLMLPAMDDVLKLLLRPEQRELLARCDEEAAAFWHEVWGRILGRLRGMSKRR